MFSGQIKTISTCVPLSIYQFSDLGTFQTLSSSYFKIYNTLQNVIFLDFCYIFQISDSSTYTEISENLQVSGKEALWRHKNSYRSDNHPCGFEACLKLHYQNILSYHD